MKPTTELRYVFRRHKTVDGLTYKTLVLQQKWVKDPFSRFKSAVKSEWRDVPIVEEE